MKFFLTLALTAILPFFAQAKSGVLKKIEAMGIERYHCEVTGIKTSGIKEVPDKKFKETVAVFAESEKQATTLCLLKYNAEGRLGSKGGQYGRDSGINLRIREPYYEANYELLTIKVKKEPLDEFEL